ncbi:hypothetical protein PIB30_045137 [Stylosanthes scabra]|uniref:Uncharacterized protein n=1 Tax=Stylosanthes scabra TaxID=79078 RepID=A0ABU6TGD3_9FABA|nr:hypothetical protein [Stylosanthes scabra]
MAQPHPLGGAAARSEIAKIHHHWSHRAPALSYWRDRTPRALERWPWHVRVVSSFTFGRSNTSVWRIHAPLLARAHIRASARWKWHVRALALGALEPTTRRSVRQRPSDRASARAH